MKKTTKLFLGIALILAVAETLRRVKKAFDFDFLDFSDEDNWGI